VRPANPAVRWCKRELLFITGLQPHAGGTYPPKPLIPAFAWSGGCSSLYNLGMVALKDPGQIEMPF